MTAAIAAFRAGNAPHILQVFEVGTATMMSAKGAIKPVYQMMKEAGEPFDPKNYLAGGGRLLHRQQGQHAVDAVQQLDAGVLRQQGRVQESRARPRSGAEDLEGVLQPRPTSSRPRASSASTPPAGRRGCISRTSAPGTTCRSAPRRTASAGTDTEFKINSPAHVKHIAMLADFAKNGWFTYSGPRATRPRPSFFSGECAMLTSSSAAQANIRKNAKFDFSVNFLPYNDDIKGAPQNSIIGGATLWVMSGKKPDGVQGRDQVLHYLS